VVVVKIIIGKKKENAKTILFTNSAAGKKI